MRRRSRKVPRLCYVSDEGLGLDVQRLRLREWAKAEGHRVVAVVADEGIAGTVPAADRPGLAEALALVADGKVDALAVLNLSRLARSVTTQEAALAMVWRTGGRVFALDSGEVLADDVDDPMRTALRQMQAVFAQLERGTIVARLRAARKLKASRGQYAGYGSPAYGTRSVEGELVADEKEQALLLRVGDLRASGASLRAIATTLQVEGFRPRRGSRWHPQVLARLVARLEAAALAEPRSRPTRPS